LFAFTAFTMHVLQIGDFQFVYVYYKFAREYGTFAYVYHAFFLFSPRFSTMQQIFFVAFRFFR